AGAALAQAAVIGVGLASLADVHGHWPVGEFAATTFARVALARVALGAGVAALAFVMARRAAGRAAWVALTLGAALLVASSAVVSHAVARVEGRALLIALDAVHQLAASVWVGGLLHLVAYTPSVRAGLAARFVPAPPRLSSPPIDELLRSADPLMGRQVERKPVERAWSEYNHHWAGLFVVLMGVLAIGERLGVRAARHWPLVFLGLATF